MPPLKGFFGRWEKRPPSQDDAETTKSDSESLAGKAKDSESRRPRFEVESLEARILMSATWVDADADTDLGESDAAIQASDDQSTLAAFDDDAAAAAESQLFDALDASESKAASHDTPSESDDAAGRPETGNEGDTLKINSSSVAPQSESQASEAGDDSESSETLDGPEGLTVHSADSEAEDDEGPQTLDYSDSSSAVTIDLSTGSVTTADGSEANGSAESVVGSDHDDSFLFGEALPGANYSVNGGEGYNTIDLSGYNRDDVDVFADHIEVNLPDGESFAIEFSNIANLQFGDGSGELFVWDGDSSNADWSEATNWNHDRIPGATDFVIFDGEVDEAITFDTEFTGPIGGLAIAEGFSSTINLGGDLQIGGDLNLEGGSLRSNGHDLDVEGGVQVSGGTLYAGAGTTTIAGDFVIEGGHFEDGNGTIEMDGEGDQLLSVEGKTLEDLRIEKPSGTLSIEGDLRIGGSFEFVSGTVDAEDSTVEFAIFGGTIDADGMSFGNIVLNGSTINLAADLDVDGDLEIKSVTNLDGGFDLSVGGNIVSTDTRFSGDATITLDGDGDQTVSTNGGIGKVHNLHVDKPDGQVTFADHVQLSGDFIVENGSVDASNATVEFQVSYGTIDAQDSNFSDVILNGSGITLASDLDVDGDLEIKSVTILDGGFDLSVGGNIVSTDTRFSGDATITLDGDGDQTVSTNGGIGKVHNLHVDKPDGQVTFADHVQLSGDFIVENGSVDASNATVEFQVSYGTIDAQDSNFSDVILNGSGITLASDLDVDGDLEIKSVTILDGGFDLSVGGNIVSTDTRFSGDATITLDGDGDQTVSTNGGIGKVHNLHVDKPDGQVTFADHVQLSGDFVVENGSVDASNATVEFQVSYGTIDAQDSSFGDVILTGSSITLASDLDVDGDLEIRSVSSLQGANIVLSGDLDSQDGSVSGSAGIILDGDGAQTLDVLDLPNGDFVIDKPSGTVVLDSDLNLQGSGQDLEIQNGELILGGHEIAVGGEVDVNGGTLSGAGTINGDLSISNSGTIQLSVPGTNPGDYEQLTVEGSVDVGADSHLALDILTLSESGSVQDLIVSNTHSGDFGTVESSSGTATIRSAIWDADHDLDLILDPAFESPQVEDGLYEIPEDGTLLIEDLLGSSSGGLAVTSVAQPSHGTLTDHGDGSLTYAPDENFHGTDTFTYTAIDSDGSETTATIEIEVTPENDAATADAGSDQSVSGTDVVILAGSGEDVDGDALSYEWVQVSGPTVALDDSHSPNPRFTAPDCLCNTVITFELHVSDGTSESVDTVDITVEADNDPPVADAGLDLVVEEGDVVTLSAGGGDEGGSGTTVDFNDVPIDSYAGSGQDISAVATVEDGGSTLHLTGNGWKSIEFPAAITEDTVLSFDFKVTELGEIHGIGFDNDSSLSPEQTFKLGGTQTWGIDGAVDLYSGDGEWVHFEIPIGEFYTGEFDSLFFANDHDSGPSDAESYYRNITISDGTNSAPTHDVEGEELTYTWVQTGGPTVVLDDNHATSPTFTAPEGLADTEITFELHVSDGTNETVDMVTITVEADNDAPVANAGSDFAVEEGGLVSLTASGGAGTSVDFNEVSIDSYAGSGQDISAVATVEGDGSTLHIEGNGWKSIEFPATITEDTVLSFDFKATELGEIHGIGFDNDSSLSPDQTFKLGGSQTWGIDGAVDPYTVEGEWVHFEIPIGEFYTGDFDNLFFANDHDAGPSDAESFFRNISIFDGTEPAPTHDAEGEELTYTWVQTGGPTVVLDDPHATSPTFTAPSGDEDSELTFELHVSDGTNESVDTINITIEANNNIPVANAGTDIEVEEGGLVSLAASGGTSVDFNDVSIDSYAGSGQDISAVATVEDNGATLHLNGNGWKSIEFPATITEDTVLSFDFKATELGEIHGIGFDNDSSLSPDQTFKIGGTQTWGIGDAVDPYTADGEWVHFEIPIGEFYTGDFDSLFFANDHDAGPSDAESFFRNITISDGTESAPTHNDDGEALTYTWVQTGGPIVVLDDPHATSPTFTAPEGLTNSEITFELQVTDGSNTATDTVTVNVNADNDAPTAEAGQPQTVEEGDTVTLAGSGTDPEGEGLNYQWVQTGGPTVTLDDPTSASPTFTAPEGLSNTDITFELHVSDGTNESVDTITIEVEADNDAPTSQAGPAQTVTEGDTVSLAGSGTDPEGEGLTYQWVQTGGPTVTLDDPTSASPTFTAPEGLSNTDITFELHVSDGTNESIDTVDITVEADNDAPTSQAGPAQTVAEGDSVSLAGSGTDPEGEGLTYQWVQTGGPTVTLDDPTSASPSFTAPEGLSNTDITFELHVSDGTNESVDTVTIEVEADNDAPTSQAGPAQTVTEGDTVSLAGSGTDPEGEGLTYEWVQTGGPTVTLDDPTSSNPSFTAPDGTEDTDIVFEFHVSDGTNGSVDTVSITVKAEDQPADEPSDDPQGETEDEPEVQPEGEPSETPPADTDEDPEGQPADEPSDDPQGETEDQPGDGPSDDPQGETEDDPADEPVTQEVDGPSEAPADDEEGDPGVEVEGNPEATDVPNSEPTLEPASIGQSDVSVENETEDSVEALPAPASAARSGLFGDYTVLYDLDQIMDESLDGDEDKIRDLNLELAQESKGQEAVPNVNDDAHEMWEASDREFDDIQFEISEGVQKEGLKSMLWAFLLRAASAVGLSERVKVDEDQDAKK